MAANAAYFHPTLELRLLPSIWPSSAEANFGIQQKQYINVAAHLTVSESHVLQGSAEMPGRDSLGACVMRN
jgi:hypothetical protein